MAPKKLTVGILGTSRVAKRGMLPGMQESELVEPLMIGSRDPERAKELAAQFGVEKFGTYEDVIGNKDVDAIYVSLPNSLHEEWTVGALEAGKHVICEKPAALSYASAKRMVEAAYKNNVRLLEGFMYRYHPQNVQVMKWIQEGALGDVVRFNGCFSHAMPDKNSNSMKQDLGGGSFNDQMPYLISASRMVFGEEPESVFCSIQYDPESKVSIGAHAKFIYPGKKIAFASSFFGPYYQSTYDVLGTRAHVRMGRAYAVPRDMSTKVFLDSDDRTEEFIFEPVSHFRNMLDEFAKEVAKRGESENGFEDDLLAQARAMEAARISAEEGRIVRIEEIK